MTLQDEFDAFRMQWTDRVGPEIAATIEADNASLQGLAAGVLREGDAFPALILPDQLGRLVDLGALMTEQPLVVTFYRGGWCPYCALELRAWQQTLPQLEALGAALVAVSPETPDHGLTTAEKNDLAFTVLSDAEARLAAALGLRFDLSPALRAYFQEAGHDLPVRNGDGRWSLPIPATYVVARGGRIALAFVDPDYRRRLDPARAIAALQTLAASAH